MFEIIYNDYFLLVSTRCWKVHLDLLPNVDQISDIEFNEGGGLVQWLKLHMWKVGDRGFVPRSGIQVSPRTRKESVLWETL